MISEMAKTTATTFPRSPMALLVMLSWTLAAMLSNCSTCSSVVRSTCMSNLARYSSAAVMNSGMRST